jgi:hypothetical protein
VAGELEKLRALESCWQGTSLLEKLLSKENLRDQPITSRNKVNGAEIRGVPKCISPGLLGHAVRHAAASQARNPDRLHLSADFSDAIHLIPALQGATAYPLCRVPPRTRTRCHSANHRPTASCTLIGRTAYSVPITLVVDKLALGLPPLMPLGSTYFRVLLATVSALRLKERRQM